MPDPRSRSLGSLLQEFLDTLDEDVQAAYRDDGLSYRPRYTPVMRTLAERGPSTITEIARHAPLTHSAVSQTVAQMVRAGLVRSRTGRDARERVVEFTDEGAMLMPRLRRHWAATARALSTISDDVGVPLEQVLGRALEVLARRPFRERIAEAAAQEAA